MSSEKFFEELLKDTLKRPGLFWVRVLDIYEVASALRKVYKNTKPEIIKTSKELGELLDTLRKKSDQKWKARKVKRAKEIKARDKRIAAKNASKQSERGTRKKARTRTRN